MEDVDLDVYFALKKKGESDYVQKDGKVWTEKVRVENGVPQNPTTVTFDGIQSGTYDVWEVADENGTPLSQGYVVIETDSQGKAILVTTIRTIHGDHISNNVTVSDEQPEDHLLVINTYAHAQETTDFIARKEWYTEVNSYRDPSKANINVPDGAWTELSIYIQGQESGEPIRTIRLDGEIDEDGETGKWIATFDGLASVDHEGYPIQYIVKETDYSEEMDGEHYFAIRDSITQSDQRIRNAVIKGNINITKEIDVAPKTAKMQALVAESLSNLKIHVTGPYDYDQEFSFSDVTDPYNPKLVIENLPAGEYFVEEIVHVDLIEGRKWNPVLSWIKEGDNEPHMREVDITVSLTDEMTPNIIIHNDYTKYDIKATKAWDDQGIDGLNHPSVPITLYQVDGEGNRKSIGTKYVPANASGEYLTVTWTDQEQQEQQYTYEITEGAIAGYEQVSITGDMFSGFTVTNKVAAQLRIVKTDQGGNPLEGATFSFAGGSIHESGLVSKISEGGTEALIYENNSLPIGEYTLSETDPPPGYNALPGDVTITVAVKNGQVIVTASINGKAISYPQLSENGGMWTLQIANDEGIEIPHTGGSGHLPYTLSGLMFVIISALMYGIRMRRRERRFR